MANGSTTSLFVPGTITVVEVLTRVLPRLKKEGIEVGSVDEWMLKIPGTEVYYYLLFIYFIFLEYFVRFLTLIFVGICFKFRPKSGGVTICP